MAITDYIDGIKRTCAPREFCMQYRETDLAFFHRLAAEEGGSHGQTTYTNTFQRIPGDRVWRAMPLAKPQVDGPSIKPKPCCRLKPIRGKATMS